MFFSKRKKKSPLVPNRILIACVSENREPFLTDVRFLFRSIGAFGGSLTEAARIAYFVDAADAEIVEELAHLGVIVKIVERFDESYPYANKLRMLEDQEDYDVLVALDCDLVVGRDFLPILESDAVMAKPVDANSLSIDQWRVLFREFNLTLPRERYITTFHAEETIPYFNSGVLVIPKRYVAGLFKAWRKFFYSLWDVYDRFPDIAAHKFFSDQFALTLALVSEKIPFKLLPLEMNFPTHFAVHSSFHPDKLEPFIFHHHHRTDRAKGLAPCTYQNINRKIGRINEILTAPLQPRPRVLMPALGNGFDNHYFWEERYRTDLQLGSGIASRGDTLAYKRRMLMRLIDREMPANVLDVGCGDLAVTHDLPIRNYTGVDVSGLVNQINRCRRPDWSFRESDFLKIMQDENLGADLVLCLDVLIHQHDRESYLNIVQGLVQATKRVGLVSGFQLPPRAAYKSEITAYHEPITETLRRAGARDIQVVGYYRDVSVVQFKT